MGARCARLASALLLGTLGLAGACADADDTGVHLTINSTALDGPTRARITTLAFDDVLERYHAALDLGRPLQEVEKLIYRASATNRSFVLDVAAEDGTGTPVASGETSVALLAGETSEALVILGAGLTDGGQSLPDGGDASVPLVDAALPVDAARAMCSPVDGGFACGGICIIDGCAPGMCDYRCSSGDSCALTVAAGACIVCDGSSLCQVTCTGACIVACSPGTSCLLRCSMNSAYNTIPNGGGCT